MNEKTQDIESKLTVAEIIQTSRPHFWIYEFGTYLVGIAATISANTLLNLQMSTTVLSVGLFGTYFLLPANLYIYGINDIFDFETDKQNPKKDEYEIRVYPRHHTQLWWWIILTNLPFLAGAAFLNITAAGYLWLFLFLFFAAFYSAPPIRAKSTPILDSFFSGAHYVATGVFGYVLAGGSSIIWPLVIAALFWSMAMHAYSAIPDIQADAAGGVQTIAVQLGPGYTLYLCLLLYTLAGLLASFYIGVFAIPITILYITMMAISLNKTKKDGLFETYTLFPYINTAVGMSLFFIALLL